MSRAFEDAMAELRNDYDDVDASKGFPSGTPVGLGGIWVVVAGKDAQHAQCC